MNAIGRLQGFWLVAGFVLWSSAFVALYGLHAMACEWSWSETDAGWWSTVRIALLAVWAAHLALIGLSIPYLRRLGSEASKAWLASLRNVPLALAAAAFVATVWIGIPVLVLPVCA